MALTGVQIDNFIETSIKRPKRCFQVHIYLHYGSLNRLAAACHVQQQDELDYRLFLSIILASLEFAWWQIALLSHISSFLSEPIK